ncbi:MULTISPECIES: gas vesicle protein [Streptomyces]|nr:MULTISPECIES: gas vesicle protein [Streptomyces]
MASTPETLRLGCEQLAQLIGQQPESVSSFQRTDDGWRLNVEVVEVSRIPDTTSLLSSYEVELDEDGGLTGYRRVRRYERGRADDQGR